MVKHGTSILSKLARILPQRIHGEDMEKSEGKGGSQSAMRKQTSLLQWNEWCLAYHTSGLIWYLKYYMMVICTFVLKNELRCYI